MVMKFIRQGTMGRIVVHSCLISNSMDQIGIIYSLWFVIYSLFPLLSLFGGLTPPLVMIWNSCPLVQPLPSFYFSSHLFEAMPREWGKRKGGPNYYHYLDNRHSLALPFLNSQLNLRVSSSLSPPSNKLPPSTLVREEESRGLVFVEEEFPSTPLQVVIGPFVVPLADTSSFQVTKFLNGNNPPTQSLE
jgi:hypothetical protein